MLCWRTLRWNWCFSRRIRCLPQNAICGVDCLDTGAALYNALVGYNVIGNATGTSTGNACVGFQAGIGDSSGVSLLTASYCTLLGYGTDSNNATATGIIAIGAQAIADAATGATSADNSAGIAIGTVGYPVGVRGDAILYPTAGIGGGVTPPVTISGYMRKKVNGTYYRVALYPDS